MPFYEEIKKNCEQILIWQVASVRRGCAAVSSILYDMKRCETFSIKIILWNYQKQYLMTQTAPLEL